MSSKNSSQTILDKTKVSLVIQAVDNHIETDWKLVVTDPSIQLNVYRNVNEERRYKIQTQFQRDIQTCFDFCTNIIDRPNWDSMCIEAKIIENIDEFTRVQYTRSKSLFPVASRDACNVFYKTALDDGRKLTLAHAVNHPKCPIVNGVVRSEAVLIGSIFQQLPGYPDKCSITQVVEVDPKGWIPHSIIKAVTALSIPSATKKLQKMLIDLPRQTTFLVTETSNNHNHNNNDTSCGKKNDPYHHQNDSGKVFDDGKSCTTTSSTSD